MSEPRLTCAACGKVTDSAEPTCKDCSKQFHIDKAELERLENAGHTFHCAARHVWGDGECECGVVPRKEKVVK